MTQQTPPLSQHQIQDLINNTILNNIENLNSTIQIGLEILIAIITIFFIIVGYSVFNKKRF